MKLQVVEGFVNVQVANRPNKTPFLSKFPENFIRTTDTKPISKQVFLLFHL